MGLQNLPTIFLCRLLIEPDKHPSTITFKMSRYQRETENECDSL